MISFLFHVILNLVSTNAVEEIKIGVILPSDSKYPFAIDRVRPAIDIACHHVHQKELLPNYRLSTFYRNSNFSSIATGTLAAIDLHITEQVHAFLGLVCDYDLAPVVRSAKYWSVISPGGLVRAFDNTEEYPTLTRIQGSFRQMTDFVQKILDKHGWNRTGILYNEDIKPGCTNSINFHIHVAESVYLMLRNRGTDIWLKRFDENFTDTFNMANILSQASAASRGRHFALQKHSI